MQKYILVNERLWEVSNETNFELLIPFYSFLFAGWEAYAACFFFSYIVHKEFGK